MAAVLLAFALSCAQPVFAAAEPAWFAAPAEAALAAALALAAASAVYWAMRRRTGRTLAAAEAQARAVIEATPVPMALVDGDQTIRYINPAFVATFGYPRDAIPTLAEWWPRACPDAAYRETAAKDWQARIEKSRRGEPVTEPHELRIVCQDGSSREVLGTFAPMEGLALVALYDITERARAQADLREKTEFLRTIFDSEPECVKVMSPAGDLLQMNAAGLAMLEVDSVVEAQRLGLSHFIKPEFKESFRALHHSVCNGNSGMLEFEIRGERKTDRWLETHAAPLRDAHGQVVAVVAVSRDVTERHRMDVEMRIAAIAFETQEGMLVTDRDRIIRRVNGAFTRITGYAAEEMIGRTPAALKSGRHGPEFYAAMWQQLERQHYWQGEIWNRRKSGETYPEWLTITGVLGPRGEVTHYVGIFSDITGHKESEERIHRLAFYDPLTELPNRRLLFERISRALAGSLRSGSRGAVVFIDLDNFKTLNDTRGHDVGDLLLVEVAKRMQRSVREQDTVARLGGDEFVVLLEDLGSDAGEAADHAEKVAQKLHQQLTRPYLLRGHTHHSTPSIGISLYGDNGASTEELLKRADAAMYQAKNAGRNTLRFFDPSMQVALESRVALEADLRLALSGGQLRLHYQAQVNELGRVVGAEALLRWQHPTQGMIAPDRFLPLAEETGLILPIGRWVLETVCAQLKAWRRGRASRQLTLAMNLSARQFRDRDFAESLREILARSGADPGKLRLELTEGLLSDEVEATIGKMTRLRELGVRFAMDDFGSGRSSLTDLRRLPLDQVKIDRSLVRDIAVDQGDAVIVRTIIGMASMLGLEVVAEGVENAEQRSLLAEAGCFLYQGDLFGKPAPIAEFRITTASG